LKNSNNSVAAISNINEQRTNATIGDFINIDKDHTKYNNNQKMVIIIIIIIITQQQLVQFLIQQQQNSMFKI